MDPAGEKYATTDVLETAGSDKSAVPLDSDQVYDVAEQRRIIHKVDRRLLVILGLMQAVSFLDRGNLANAAVSGMTKDLDLSVGKRYSLAILVFFIPYVLLQFPAAILVRKVGPRIFLSSIVVAWGIVMMCLGFVHEWTDLLPLRLLLGAFEAGCYPSQYYLISSWYSKFDLYTRTSVFYLIGVLGSALGGVLALAFSEMGGLSNIVSWRWIFIMEGLITIAIGLAGFIFVVDFPEKAHKSWRFLTEDEAAFIVRRINRDREDATPEPFSFGRILQPALDPKIWAFALTSFCTTVQAYSVGYFLPIILETELGFAAAKAQGLSTPPYLIAMLLMYVESYISDKVRLRSPILYFNSIICIIGLCLLVWTAVPGVQYFGAILVTAGCSSNLPTVMVFQANNIRGAWKRAFSSASMIGFGGVGGIAGSLVFRTQDAPKYLPGIETCLVANAVTIIVTTILVFYFCRQNKRADEGRIIIEGLSNFRYVI
ncbi:phthalate transporter [Coniella lustricola]|uniref:Phthalate transporter n=1 Tax=Coniella lustricola TaxID=2025994 RepID=A0A2T3A429_9PEZI|nr:phthalate transporter [Coniella lustricola]